MHVLVFDVIDTENLLDRTTKKEREREREIEWYDVTTCR